jgi:hypothetical protein
LPTLPVESRAGEGKLKLRKLKAEIRTAGFTALLIVFLVFMFFAFHIFLFVGLFICPRFGSGAIFSCRAKLFFQPVSPRSLTYWLLVKSKDPFPVVLPADDDPAIHLQFGVNPSNRFIPVIHAGGPCEPPACFALE